MAPTTQVSPADLRGAAKRLVPGPHGMPYNAHTDAGAFTFAALGMSSLATASALRVSRQAADSAVGVIRARFDEWQSILTTSADDYENTDVEAADRLKGLGDLNHPPTASTQR